MFMCVILIVPQRVFSVEKQGGENFEAGQRRFIKKLYKKGDYHQSIAEAERLSYYGEGVKKEEINYFRRLCYFRGGQYKSVIDDYQGDTEGLLFRDYLLISRSYRNLGRKEDGFSVLQSLGPSSLSGNESVSLCALKMDYLLDSNNYGAAHLELKNFKPLLEPEGAEALRRELKKYENYRFPSPVCSVALSALIPGMGQVYSGRIIDGLLTLSGFAGTAFAAYYSHERGYRAMSYTAGFFSVLFYSGGLYGAYQSAMTASRDNTRDFMEGYRKGLGDYLWKPENYLVKKGILE